MLPDNIRFIQRGWLNANSILILGDDGPVLIDTGYVTHIEETLALIRQEGVDPADLRLIVNTHGHSDHIGGNPRLKALSGAPIATSELTAVWLANNDRHKLWLSYLGQDADLIPADIILPEGERVTLGGLPFEIIATPGHALDAISLYQPDHKLLICADAMWENDVGILNVAVHGRSALDLAEESIGKFKQLDVAVALPGHGGIIQDVAENLSAIERRLARFRAEPAQIGWHLIRRAMMFNVLRYQPISREAFMTRSLATPCLHDYAPICGYDDGRSLLSALVDEFLSRDLVQEKDGLLTTGIIG